MLLNLCVLIVLEVKSCNNALFSEAKPSLIIYEKVILDIGCVTYESVKIPNLAIKYSMNISLSLKLTFISCP
jgi:hypothetical protein